MSDGTTGQWGRRTFLKATGAAGAAAALPGVASASEGGQYLVGVSVPDEIEAVVEKLPDQVTELARDEALGAILTEVEDLFGIDVGSLLSQIEGIAGVEYVEENRTYEPLEVHPDDAKYTRQYAPQQVSAPEAWETTTGSDDVTVAVVDQGVMYDHPDLTDRFGETEGKDFVGVLGDDGDPYPEDMEHEYHGTHVAGIAAASSDNGEGIAGLSDSRLLSARVLKKNGGMTWDIAQGIRWAADQGADVINLSLGGSLYSPTMKAAVIYARHEGSLPVAAAGNDGGDVGYPAAYSECVAVSALDRNEDLADFSSRGSTVDVAAPGVDVLSCWTEDDREYARISGTSMASPVVAGVAALLKADNPDMGPADLKATLERSAVDVGLPETQQGSGRVDAASALTMGHCGNSYERTRKTGRLGAGESDAYTYSPQSDRVCEVAITLDTERHYPDFDLFVTLDGRTPTADDNDRKSRSPKADEKVVLADDEIGTDAELGVLVRSYSETSDYTLTVEEWGGVSNEPPEAVATASSTDVTEDEEVTFHAADSTDPDDNIARYEWTIPQPGNWIPGAKTVTGETASHAFGTGGDVEVTLKVVDEQGRSDTDTVTVHVEEDWWPGW